MIPKKGVHIRGGRFGNGRPVDSFKSIRTFHLAFHADEARQVQAAIISDGAG
jgi:hypothetical protein